MPYRAAAFLIVSGNPRSSIPETTLQGTPCTLEPMPYRAAAFLIVSGNPRSSIPETTLQ